MSTTKAKNTTTKTVAAPKGTYLEQARVALVRAGIVEITDEVVQWLERQQAAGVEIEQLVAKWKEPENALLATKLRDIGRITYVTDELQRMVERQNDRRDELAKHLESEGVEKITEVAAASAETLISTTARIKTYVRFLATLKRRAEANHTPAEIFETVSGFAYNDLAKNASHLGSRSTSWQENERKVAEVVALAEVANLFIDVSKI